MTSRRTAPDNGHVLDVGRIDPDPTVGNIVEAVIVDPVIDTGETLLVDVSVSLTSAHDAKGARCIYVTLPADRLVTAKEAHHLTVHLAAAKDVVAGIRTDLGYNQ
jgi:hypoxanthine phosphoribosyltransferase